MKHCLARLLGTPCANAAAPPELTTVRSTRNTPRAAVSDTLRQIFRNPHASLSVSVQPGSADAARTRWPRRR